MWESEEECRKAWESGTKHVREEWESRAKRVRVGEGWGGWEKVWECGMSVR